MGEGRDGEDALLGCGQPDDANLLYSTVSSVTLLRVLFVLVGGLYTVSTLTLILPLD